MPSCSGMYGGITCCVILSSCRYSCNTCPLYSPPPSHLRALIYLPVSVSTFALYTRYFSRTCDFCLSNAIVVLPDLSFIKVVKYLSSISPTHGIGPHTSVCIVCKISSHLSLLPVSCPRLCLLVAQIQHTGLTLYLDWMTSKPVTDLLIFCIACGFKLR